MYVNDSSCHLLAGSKKAEQWVLLVVWWNKTINVKVGIPTLPQDTEQGVLLPTRQLEKILPELLGMASKLSQQRVLAVFWNGKDVCVEHRSVLNQP